MQLTARIQQARTTLTDRRTERLAQRRLSDELATYTTQDDRAELDTVLERYPAEATEEIRMILLRQDAIRAYAAAARGNRN